MIKNQRKSPRPARKASLPPLRLEYLDPSDLKANPANWRKHPPAQMRALRETIRQTGWAGTLLYNERTKRLLDGHARKALFEGKGRVPVLVGSWDERTERKILALLDPIGNMAHPDQAALDKLLRSLATGSDKATRSLLDEMTGTLQPALRTETVKVSSLKFHPRNYRKHPEDQLDHLIASIEEHGFYRNVVIARDGTVLAGQGVVQAAQKMGKERIPVVRLNLAPGDKRALKVIAGDNEIAKLAEVDDRALTELLKEIMGDDGKGLMGTGYDAMMLANLVLVSRPASEIAGMDEAAEWAGMPEYQMVAPYPKLIVSFRTEEDKEAFGKLIGAPVTKQTKGVLWPYEGRKDPASLRFASGQGKDEEE